MGKNSTIEWTDHTFNPWIGCFKVSQGCAHCYAETLNHRWGHDNWGPPATTLRRRTAPDNWKQPYRWDREARAAGVRRRVFCASMADVFEDHPQVAPWRAELFEVIAGTPHLDWLLLTKRPENIMPMLRAIPVLKRDNVGDVGDHLWPQHFPHVWLGTSVEDQAAADKRIPELLRVPARLRFLSCEPLLGPVDLSRYIGYDAGPVPLVDWVIAGGESGHSARPMHPDWVRSLRDQCQAAGVAFHFKQWGAYVAEQECPPDARTRPSLWGASVGAPSVTLYQPGKHAAGRTLDGRTWDEVPS